jgi:hypothetical protein
VICLAGLTNISMSDALLFKIGLFETMSSWALNVVRRLGIIG